MCYHWAWNDNSSFIHILNRYSRLSYMTICHSFVTLRKYLLRKRNWLVFISSHFISPANWKGQLPTVTFNVESTRYAHLHSIHTSCQHPCLSLFHLMFENRWISKKLHVKVSWIKKNKKVPISKLAVTNGTQISTQFASIYSVFIRTIDFHLI